MKESRLEFFNVNSLHCSEHGMRLYQSSPDELAHRLNVFVTTLFPLMSQGHGLRVQTGSHRVRYIETPERGLPQGCSFAVMILPSGQTETIFLRFYSEIA